MLRDPYITPDMQQVTNVNHLLLFSKPQDDNQDGPSAVKLAATRFDTDDGTKKTPRTTRIVAQVMRPKT